MGHFLSIPVRLGCAWTVTLVALALLGLASCGGSSRSSDGPSGALGNPQTGDASLTSGDQEAADALPRWVSAANKSLGMPVALCGAFPTTGQAPKTVHFFDDGSFDDNGIIVKMEWNFGDQGGGKNGWYDYTSTAGTAYHTYTSPGTYNAQMRVTDEDGNMAELSTIVIDDKSGAVNRYKNYKIKITITSSGNANPVAQANASPFLGTAPLEVSFNAAGSFDPDGFVTSWEWDLLGNGVFADYTLSEGAASFTYVASGTYQPVLRIKDDNGAVAEASLTIYVNQVPNAVAAATPDHGYPPMAVSFDGGGSSDSDGSIVSYEWNFGEGGGYEDFGTSPSASHTYNSAGNYTAMLRVTDNAGATATAAASVDTTAAPPNESPVAVGSVDLLSGTNPLTVQFRGNASYDPDGAVVSWEWDLGDGSGYQDYSTTEGVLQFTYINSGNYFVTLRVVDADGASDTESFDIHVNAHPSALGHAVPATGIAPLQSSLNASGCADSDGTIVLWQWDFGQGGGFQDFTSTAGAATHTYSQPGSYTATLLITDNEGGQDICNLPIEVDQASALPSNGDWPMFGYDAQHTGCSPFSGPATNAVKWACPTGTAWYLTSPVIGVNGKVYAGSWDGNVYSIDPSISPVTSTALFYAGGVIYSPPAIGVDTNGVETLYVASETGCLCAIDPSNGSENWRYPSAGQLPVGPIHSSPVIGLDRTVYVASLDGYVCAINANGSLKWRCPHAGQSGVGAIFSTPAISKDDNAVYVASYDGNTYAIYAHDDGNGHYGGDMKWASPTGQETLFSSPAIGADNSVYVAGAALYAFDGDTGSQKWLNPPLVGAVNLAWSVGSSPVIGVANGVETIYVAGATLHAFDTDGNLLWDSACGTDGSSPAIGLDGTLYVGGNNNQLYAIDKATGGLTWAATTGWYLTSPAIAENGSAYAGSWDGNLYAIGPDGGA